MTEEPVGKKFSRLLKEADVNFKDSGLSEKADAWKKHYNKYDSQDKRSFYAGWDTRGEANKLAVQKLKEKMCRCKTMVGLGKKCYACRNINEVFGGDN